MQPLSAGWLRFSSSPMVITGITLDNLLRMNSSIKPTSSDRSRLSVELSPVVSSHLDHISEVTGLAKASIIAGALLDALPELLARADGLKKRHQELSQVKGRK